MKANTIKLEEKILNDINHFRPKNQSMSSFVRELIYNEINRKKLIAAAEEYELFLNEHPEEKKQPDGMAKRRFDHMKRGAIYWVNLEPSHPPELGKTRPALIVSNTDQNSILGSVVIVPLSSQPAEIWPLRLEIKIPKQKNSYAIIPGIRQISKTRIGNYIGLVSSTQMTRISEALKLYLGN